MIALSALNFENVARAGRNFSGGSRRGSSTMVDRIRKEARLLMAPDSAHVERRPWNYDWRTRLPDNQRLIAIGEGSATYAAEGEGAWWIVVDEGTLADFLDPVRDADVINTLVRLQRFDDRQSWDAAIAQRQARLTPQQRRLVEMHGTP